MSARWPAFGSTPKGAKLDNDKSHAHLDPNSGGGPAAPVVRNAKRIPNAHRGGPYQSGQRSYGGSSTGNSRGGSGNPASRGGAPIGAMSPDMSNPNPGGAPAMTGRMDPVSGRGGFGNTGQQGVPNYGPTNPRPGAGNTGGRMHKRIAGNFTNRTKGASGNKGVVGSYGKAF